MTPIPPDAKRVVLAAVVPCVCDGTDVDRQACAANIYDACFVDGDRCNGDLTRTVVTDIEVEREQMYAGPREAEWDTPEDVWVEVAL